MAVPPFILFNIPHTSHAFGTGINTNLYTIIKLNLLFDDLREYTN